MRQHRHVSLIFSFISFSVWYSPDDLLHFVQLLLLFIISNWELAFGGSKVKRLTYVWRQYSNIHISKRGCALLQTSSRMGTGSETFTGGLLQ